MHGSRKDSKVLYNNSVLVSPKFSDLTNNSNNTNNKKNISGIQKKIIRKKVVDEVKNNNSEFKVIEFFCLCKLFAWLFFI